MNTWTRSLIEEALAWLATIAAFVGKLAGMPTWLIVVIGVHAILSHAESIYFSIKERANDELKKLEDNEP